MIGHCAKRQHHHCVHGFTLIDMVMVLVVMSIVTVIAAPRFTSGMTRYKAEATARQIAADLKWARAEAVARSGAVEVRFDFVNSTYTIIGVTSLDRRAVDNLVDLEREPYNATLDTAFGKSSATDTSLSLWFDGYGKPNLDGLIEITVASEKRSIQVDGETGAIEVVATN